MGWTLYYSRAGEYYYLHKGRDQVGDTLKLSPRDFNVFRVVAAFLNITLANINSQE